MTTNQISGTLPQQLQNCGLLKEISLSRNSLFGTIPDVFHNMTHLGAVFLQSNKFTGQIPPSLWEIDEFSNLMIQDNDIHGNVPIEFCEKVTLSFVIDDSTWFTNDGKVNCTCCVMDASCNVWETSTRNIDCPSDNIRNFDFTVAVLIIDFVNRTNITLTDPNDMCFSPTGCYYIWILDLD